MRPTQHETKRGPIAAQLLLALFAAVTCVWGALVFGQIAHLEPQPVVQALREFRQQTGVQLLYQADSVVTPKASGRVTADRAFVELLADAGLEYEFVNDRTAARERALSAQNERFAVLSGRVSYGGRIHLSGRRSLGRDGAPSVSGLTLPEVLVRGARSLNVDIQSSEDDIQPYVMARRDQIHYSGEDTLEELFGTALGSAPPPGRRPMYSI